VTTPSANVAIGLSCEDVSVRFGNVEALRSVSVRIAPKTHLVVTGAAGSGKTTFLKCLTGLIRPSHGTVSWNDQNVASFSAQDRRTQQGHFGMVFQSDALFDSMTVFENVVLPLVKRHVGASEATERAMEALRRVGLERSAGLHPEVLSGGMRKRVGVARAIVAQPAILLADDPFAGLDPETEEGIAQLLLEVADGRTLIAALPDPSQVLPISRVMRFESGRVIDAAVVDA
jgi:phospholipid/cholesterol/gamma-HCH transport system ATP-binding protein